jgi:hypothetical protein
MRVTDLIIQACKIKILYRLGLAFYHTRIFLVTDGFSQAGLILYKQKKTFFMFFSSCLYRASIVSKTLLIIPTDAHNYKIIGMLKTIKVPTIAPTCFGSRRNRHQGAISCLAKTAIMILLCSSLMTWSMLWRHTSLLCKQLAQQAGMPP